MKKLNLQLGSIKEMLTKEQMKKVAGGYDAEDCPTSTASGWCYTFDPVTGLLTVPVQCTQCLYDGSWDCGDDLDVYC